MSISINYSSTIGLHGIDPVITSKHLIEWITSYNDITVTGKTNFNNDIKLSYDSLNFLNINIDENANTIFNITNVGNNNNLSTFIYNNKIQANNGISINGDTIIGDSIDNSLFINSDIYINNNTIFNDVFFKDNVKISGNLDIKGDYYKNGVLYHPAYGFNVNKNGDQTIYESTSNATETIINWNYSGDNHFVEPLENFDSNNGVYTIPINGYYQINTIVRIDGSNDYTRVFISVNDTTVFYRTSTCNLIFVSGNNNDQSGTLNTILKLNEDDTIRIKIHRDSSPGIVKYDDTHWSCMLLNTF